MQVRFVGCGDAFGSGGRFNTCFHVTTSSASVLIDCGASSMIALKAQDIDPNAIEAIIVTHFHGDHFGGLPYFMLDAQFFSKRTAPLTLAGPQGLQDWFVRVMETTFPGSSSTRPKFELRFVELEPGESATICDLEIKTARVKHGPPHGPFHAYRVSQNGRSLAYTGDTEWVDDLIDIARDVDLLIAEAYFYEKKVPLHLDLATLKDKLPLINPKRLILTHMNDDMLSRIGQIPFETAKDGLLVTV